MVKKAITLIILSVFVKTYGNAQDFKQVNDSIEFLLTEKKYDECIAYVEKELKKNNPFNANEKNQLFFKLYLSHYRNKRRDLSYQTLLKAKKYYGNLNNIEKGKLLFYLAYINQVHTKRYDSVIFYSLKSLPLFTNKTIQEKNFIAKNHKILSRAYRGLQKDSLEIYYLKKRFLNYLDLNNKKEIAYALNNIGTFYSSSNSKFFNLDSSIYYYKKGLLLDFKHRITGSMYSNIGAIYQEYLKENDSANYFYEKALKYNLSTISKGALYFNKGVIAEEKKQYELAIKFYEKSNDFAKESEDLSAQTFAQENLSNVFVKLNNYEQALFYRKLSYDLKDSIRNIEIIKNADDVKIKYDVKNKEKEFLKLRERHTSSKIRNRSYIVILTVVIISLLIIGYFILKNSYKKRLLALQEKELETQKNLNLIKEQEITSINAMIEGQEKERKRVAEDLHDNLGSVIATLKLHFENLRMNREKKKVNQETLFDKTENLIDEAYLKVRSIAHAKNAGVIANEGLLVAVQMMAEKISSANTLEIQVVYSGLEKPLENSLEISLFRIIQELTTNIVKHAEASFVTIGLNEHRDGINMMIEDNGKGMDVSRVDFQKGMGIYSIQTRVEHLNGDFTIDSTPTKGTTVIINVPLR